MRHNGRRNGGILIMPAGRPRKFDTPEEMQREITAYFDVCKSKDYLPTICGLALALGFTSRQSLLDYEGYSDQFFDAIKRAKLQIEEGYERHLIKGRNAAGPIFALKNFNWKDHQDINLGGQKDNPVQIVRFDDTQSDIS